MRIHKISIYVLVLVVCLSGQVSPKVYAVETAEVFSAVYTSTNTGGQSATHGRDGQDGTPGGRGQNGTDGASGSDGFSTVSGDSSATIHIESIHNGEKNIDIYKTSVATKTDNSFFGAALQMSEGTTTSWITQVRSDSYAEEDVALLEKTLMSIRLILLSYVKILF